MLMTNHPRAGQLAKQEDLINVAQLISYYYVLKPDLNNIEHMVKFGTSGHRGSSENQNFNEMHILAIAQAISEERKKNSINGPCYVGKDTHALSEPAILSVLEVLIANGINVIIQKNNGYTPTPSISNALLEHNKNSGSFLADGIMITPSHNPPNHGGIKYNSPNGGPSNTNITKTIETRANQLIKTDLKEVKRLPSNKIWTSGYIQEKDLIQPYIEGLSQVINFSAIKKVSLKIGVDPLGGSGILYWKKIAEYYKLNITIINDSIDQTFRFMHLDKDGLIRMDCSSKYAMSGLLDLRKNFDIAFSNDPDHDRHGIITPYGLMHSNDYLVVAINYLFQNRPLWSKKVSIGKTIVSSIMIDKIANHISRKIVEVPVGFKWFSDGLFNGNFGFSCEESAGASFLKFDGTAWSTDKDGIILCLLAAEITAVTGKNPQQHYNELVTCFGPTSYNRIQLYANLLQKSLLSKLSPKMINKKKLAGYPIISCLNLAPGNGQSIGGIKIITKNGWFAVRPSGTEDVYKIYCESLLSSKHRMQIEKEALEIINTFLKNT